MLAGSAVARVKHPIWGNASLVRIEGTDWILQIESSGQKIRVSAENRRQFELLPELPPMAALPIENGERGPDWSEGKKPAAPNRFDSNRVEALLRIISKRAAQQGVASPEAANQVNGTCKSERGTGANGSLVAALPISWTGATTWQKQRAVESLANGLPPSIGLGRHLAFDFDSTTKMISRFLRDVSEDGGCALVVKGGYGQGKTFALKCLEEIALESGFLVAHTEVDATENRLNKPYRIYRDLLRHLRVPGQSAKGAAALAAAANAEITRRLDSRSGDADFRLDWLQRHLGCAPLAWLFADPMIDSKGELLALLGCDASVPIARARKCHALMAEPRRWPAFSAGTQGDFGSFLLSGIGRLARLMRLKGLIVILDEMEKWQDLNWNEQAQAGNLLGGLIWGATESGDRRRRRKYPGGLSHSIRCGGHPFSTEEPCYLGLAIAMTPRSEGDDPERIWAEYGPLLDIKLPQLTASGLRQYCHQAFPLFADAYGARLPIGSEVGAIVDSALELWRTHGEMTNRAAVQSAVAAFNGWRERALFSNNA